MAMFSAFVDEMQKLAASKDRMSIPKARSGRRSMSVETVLKKEKDGSLFKKTAEELPERDKLVQEEASRQSRRATGNTALAGGGAVLGGAGLSALSQVPGGLFGYKTLHHGTDAISAASIREHGLKPLNQLNLEPNEAASKTMGSLMGLDTTGLAYASSNVLDPAKFSLIRASTSGVKPSIVTGHIPYDRFKNEWTKDPEGRIESVDFGLLPKDFSPQLMSEIGLAPEDLAKTHLSMIGDSLKNPSKLLQYAKENPGRVAASLAIPAVAALGAYGAYRGIKGLANQRHEKALAAKDPEFLAAKERFDSAHAATPWHQRALPGLFHNEERESAFKNMLQEKVLAEGRARDAHFAKQADAIGIESENGRTKYLHGDEAEKAMEGINQSLGAMTDPIFTGIRHMFSHGELEGGIAERAGKEPQDFDPYELAKGIQDEEEEHTNDLATARQIAMDHLVKHPLYYEELPKMEEKLTEEEEAQGLSAKQPEREKEAWAKLADSWKPQWLELNSAPNDYFMQNTNVVMGKKARGDAPSMQEGLTEGQASRTPASYAQPTNCAMAMKDASAHWSKIAKAVMGPQVRSPTDTVPDVEGPPNRMQRQEDRNFFIGPSSDAQPITGTSTDAYSRN